MTGNIQFSLEIATTLGISGFAILLFISERVTVDVAALLVMLLIGLAGQMPWIHPPVPATLLFSGFSSNAVISVIAIMILGAGLDKTGLMDQVAILVLGSSRHSERRIVAKLSTSIGLVSAFMQNVGATALFLPVVSRIATEAAIPVSRLLIPVGFCAILGGTLSMVGCSSLIILNDLIQSANTVLAVDSSQLRHFGLFDVTPIGIALLVCGILFFSLFGRQLLPDTRTDHCTDGHIGTIRTDTWAPGVAIFETRISPQCGLHGKTIRQIEDSGTAPQMISFRSGSEVQISPSRDDIIWAGSTVLISGPEDTVRDFARDHQLDLRKVSASDRNLHSRFSGLCEVVIPPGSRWVGHSVGEIRLRRHYSASLIAVHRGTGMLVDNLRALKLQSGDTLLLYCRWTDLASMAKNRDFVVASDYPKNMTRPEKLPVALGCFGFAMSLVLLTNTMVPLALLSGALAMVLTGVLSMDEAYRSIGWKTVFLLAGLIPLGIAFNRSGTATWLAQTLLLLCAGLPAWIVQFALAVIATALTLVISNVGATVILVPLAMSIALDIGADPSVFALTVALATSNSFLIPTHQVNALIMGPGGYRVRDFTRAGGLMTLLYLLILVPAVNQVFPPS